MRKYNGFCVQNQINLNQAACLPHQRRETANNRCPEAFDSRKQVLDSSIRRVGSIKLEKERSGVKIPAEKGRGKAARQGKGQDGA
jgi:hypothetical protein